MDENGRPLTAKEKRQEQLKLWETSSTNSESGQILNPRPKVKFNDGAVFLAACSSGDLEELKILLNKGADINFANIDGLTALHTACIDCKIEVVSFLIDHGANIDQEDNEGWTPLHATTSCGFMDIARYLVEKGANVVAVNSEGEVPLDIAEEDDMIEYLQQQIQAQGLDIDKARNQEREMMIVDAQQQLKSVLSGEKLTVLVHPNSGASALHVAAAKGYNDVIRLLLKSGMDINIQDNDGWTPLHAAAHWSQQESAKILSDRGASFTVKNKLGQIAYDVADEDMLEYLDDLKTHQVEVKKDSPEEHIANNRHEDYITNYENDSNKEPNRNRRTSREITSSSDEDDSSSSNELLSSRSTRKQPPEKQGKFEYNADQSRSLFGLNQSEISQIIPKNSENKLKESASVGNVPGTRGAKSSNRPASLHITSTASTSKDIRPSIQSAQDFTDNKSNKSNGPPQTPSTPSERNSNIKDAQPNTWRIGLRKTGSFDDKMRAIQRPIGTNYTPSRTSESGSPTKTQDSVKTARVAPIPVIDARTNKVRNKEDTSSDVFNFQRTGSYRKYGSETTSSTNPSTYKRSTTESKPETTSAELSSTTTTTTKTNLSAQMSNDSPDRRRSFLQPVRDEEAEAQRKARSRRERQSRRSTQGVTLDVFEEAKRQIDTMKTEKAAAAAAAAANKSDNTESIHHNDSSSSLHRRLVDPASSNSTSTPSSLSTKSSVTLPSGYIPPTERVKNTTKTITVPSISIQDDGGTTNEKSKPDDKAEEDSNNVTPAGHSPSVRKNAAQQKRRQRKERRSTGLPGLKPSEANNVDNQSDDELFGAHENKNSDRLREPLSRFDSSTKRGFKGSNSDIPDKLNAGKDYKKMYEEKCSELDRLREELEKEKKGRKQLEKELADMEKELMNDGQVKAMKLNNQVLKQENLGLDRMINRNVEEEFNEQDSLELSDHSTAYCVKTPIKSTDGESKHNKMNSDPQFDDHKSSNPYRRKPSYFDTKSTDENDITALYEKSVESRTNPSKRNSKSRPPPIKEDSVDSGADFSSRKYRSAVEPYKRIGELPFAEVQSSDDNTDSSLSYSRRKQSSDSSNKISSNDGRARQLKNKFPDDSDNTTYTRKQYSKTPQIPKRDSSTYDNDTLTLNSSSDDFDSNRVYTPRYTSDRYVSKRYPSSYDSTESLANSGLSSRRCSNNSLSGYEPSSSRSRKKTDHSSLYNTPSYNPSSSYLSDRKGVPSPSSSLYHTIPIPSKSHYKSKLGPTSSLGANRLSPGGRRIGSTSPSRSLLTGGGSRARDLLSRNPVTYTSSASSKRVGNLMDTYRNQSLN